MQKICKNAFYKIICILICILAFSFFLKLPAYAYPKEEIKGATSEFYVNDYAGILDSETKQEILDINKILYSSKEKIQFVVTTINNLNNHTIEDYAVKHFEKIKPGDKKQDTGILLLISKEDRKIKLEVGYGLEGCLTDSVCGNILDHNLEALKKNDYSAAVKGIAEEIYQKLSSEYDDIDKDAIEYKNVKTKSSDGKAEIIFIIAVIILSVILSCFTGSNFIIDILRIILSSGGSGRSGRYHDNDRNSGGGGSSGGGGASRDF